MSESSGEVSEHWVSITGLKLRHPLHAPVFWMHAVRCMILARQTPGNLGADTRTIENVHYTVSAWESPASMRAFIKAPLHIKAMEVYPRIATGKVLSLMSHELPEWSDVPDLLERSGRIV